MLNGFLSTFDCYYWLKSIFKISDTFYPGLRIYLKPARAIILQSIIILTASPKFYDFLEFIPKSDNLKDEIRLIKINKRKNRFLIVLKT